MTDRLFHPEPEQLEALAAGDVEDGDAVVLESHLQACGRCRTEVEEWRALFGALADLPEVRPSPAFADRVMASVRIPQPLVTRVAGAVERFVPHTRRAWAVVGAMLGLPAMGSAVLVAWFLNQPWLTLQGLLAFGGRQVTAFLTVLPGRLLDIFSRTSMGVWATEAVGFLTSRGLASVGAVAGLFAALTAASAWVLYRNLFRSSPDDGYASLHV